MIKQTYYNLSNEKKQRIINAVMQEIAGKSYDEISINKIVKRAEISRGSFYQYFDDKKDLMELIMQDFIDDFRSRCISLMKDSNGDVFVSALGIFDFVADSVWSEKYSEVFRIVFSFTSANNDFFNMPKKECDHTLAEELKSFINRDTYKIENNDDVNLIINITVSLLFKQFFELFVVGKERTKVRNNLEKMFLLLKNGIVRR